MKKNVKKLTFLSLLTLMGCANYKNVVTEVNTDRAVLRDIKTGKTRVYDCSTNNAAQSVLMWLAVGDTVTLQSDDYARGVLFTPENSQLSCNWVELQRRKEASERAEISKKIDAEFAKQDSILRKARGQAR